MTRCVSDIIDHDFQVDGVDDTFVSQMIRRTKLNLSTEFDPSWVLQKIVQIEKGEISLEKIVIEKILLKKINWIDFLTILRILDPITVNHSTLMSIFNDCVHNSANQVLDIIEFHYSRVYDKYLWECDSNNQKWIAI